MIKHAYLRHHTQYEDEYDDDELAMVLRFIIHDFWEGLSAFESLTLANGTVLSTIDQVEQMQEDMRTVESTAQVLPLTPALPEKREEKSK